MCTLDRRFNRLVEVLKQYIQNRISLEELNAEIGKIENVQHFLAQERDWSHHILIDVKFETHLDYVQFTFESSAQCAKITLRYDFQFLEFTVL
jgi:hypothetical protein